MILLGCGIGLSFPTMASLLGVPGNYVQNPVFYLTCIAAGVVLGTANLFLAQSMVGRVLRRVIHGLQVSASQVSAAAAHIDGQTRALAQASDREAALVAGNAAASNRVSASARLNATSATEAADLASVLQQRFEQTSQTLGEIVGAMDRMNQSSSEIARIIRIIDEIAFQTNILALNAAVEAARAGEAGLGFAVVAEEVRSLAQRSASAAHDSASLIEQSISRTNVGAAKVKHLSARLEDVLALSNQIGTLASRVREGSQDQATSIADIDRGITESQSSGFEVSKNAQECTRVVTELESEAESLMDAVAQISALVGDSGSGHRPLTPR